MIKTIIVLLIIAFPPPQTGLSKDTKMAPAVVAQVVPDKKLCQLEGDALIYQIETKFPGAVVKYKCLSEDNKQ